MPVVPFTRFPQEIAFLQAARPVGGVRGWGLGEGRSASLPQLAEPRPRRRHDAAYSVVI